jgi:hypothetical protein
MIGYRVPAPDEALLISGGKAGRDGAPFRVVTGRGAFVMPFLRQASFPRRASPPRTSPCSTEPTASVRSQPASSARG